MNTLADTIRVAASSVSTAGESHEKVDKEGFYLLVTGLMMNGGDARSPARNKYFF